MGKSLTKGLQILDRAFLQMVAFRQVAGKQIPLRPVLRESYARPHHLPTHASFFCLVARALGCIRRTCPGFELLLFCTIPAEIDGG